MLPDYLEYRADFLAVAAGIYNTRGILALSKESQDAACRRLHGYRLLSYQSIGAIVGVSVYRVQQATKGMISPLTQGHLNPQHLGYLAYLLAAGKVHNSDWIKTMVSGGTNVATIVDLTGISRSTINRRLHD